MGVIDYRLLLDQRRSSTVSLIGKKMHALGGTGMEASCSVWWIDGTALGNGNGLFLPVEGRWKSRKAIYRSYDCSMLLRG